MTNDKVRKALEKIRRSYLIWCATFQSEYVDDIARLTDEALKSLASDPWQPIETAPKDAKALYGYWDHFNNWCTHLFTGSHEPSIYGYTHWQPLPEPPKNETSLKAADTLTLTDVGNFKVTMKDQK